MKKGQAIVVANTKTGDVVTMRQITNKDGETRDVGVVMVQSKTLSGLGTLARVATRTAFITLEEDALDFLEGELKDGQPFPQEGKIVIEETLEPYIRKDGTKQEPKINPTTEEVITYKGQPVYRNSYFTEDVNAQDIFLKESANAMAGTDAPE